jgi:triosephosphate isomerase (TIM)
MQRQKIAAGNWKMHKTVREGVALAAELAKGWYGTSAEIVIAPPFIHLADVQKALQDSKVKLAAQNCHTQKEGAFTGEVSAYMLREMRIDYVIIGHSERREYFRESDALLREKVDAVLEAGLKCIFCCGESLDIREDGAQEAYVKDQLEGSLLHLGNESMKHIVVAYEPIWAIGTGLTATPQQAQDMHGFIRGILADKYGEEISDKIPILYGGSVKPGNANALFAQKDIDGGLVGGASLKAADFLEIGQALERQ